MAVPSCGNGKSEYGGESFNFDFKREQIFVWTPGKEALVLPDNVGFPMFDNEFKQAIRIEIHYNNPKLISGMRDSSGVRLHYTSTPRLHEAAFLQLGDPLLGLYGMEIADGLTKHEFTCGGSCSSFFLDEPVTVIAETLYMQKFGARMVNEVIRGDEVVHTAKVEVFDFDQQGKLCPVGFVTFLVLFCFLKECFHSMTQAHSKFSKTPISYKRVISFAQLAITKMALHLD